jgi:hypothetical protein
LTPLSDLGFTSSAAGIAEQNDQYAQFDMLQPIVVPIIAPAPLRRKRSSFRRVRGRVQEASEEEVDGGKPSNSVEDECMADSESSRQNGEDRSTAPPLPRNGWMATVMNDSSPAAVSPAAGSSSTAPDVAEDWLNEHIEPAAEAFEGETPPRMLSPSPEEATNLPGPIRPPQTHVYPYRGAETFTRYQDRNEHMDTDSD